MFRTAFKYIVICALVLAIAFGIGQVRQRGMGSAIEGVTNWWTGVCEWFEDLTSKEEDAEATDETTEATEEATTEATEPSTEATEVVDETVPEETVPEEQPPVVGDEPIFIENSDKTISMCSYEFLAWAQRNEKYDEQIACGPINVPHEDDEVYQVFFSPCEQMETLKHNHDGQQVKMMINLNKVSVFCCDEKDADHSVGVWNLNKIFCVGFKDTRVEVCKTCKGLANGDKVIGEVMEMELSEEDWAEIQKVACYWWETDEESGELVRVFGLKPCTCDTPNPSKPATPGKPNKPGKPSDDDNGGDEDTTNPTDPEPTDPTDPTEGGTDHNPDPEPTDPTEGKPDHNPDPVPTEPDSTPTDKPVIDNGEPPVEDEPEKQPDVQDEPVSTPTDKPVIDNGEPPVEEAPVEQPSVNDTNHNPDPVPVENVPEAQPEVEEEPVSVPVSAPVIDNGEPPVEEVPEEQPNVEEHVNAPIIDNGEPPVEEIPHEQPDVEQTAHNADPVPVDVVSEAQPVVEAQPAVEAPAPAPAPVIDNGEPPVESAHSSDPVPQA